MSLIEEMNRKHTTEIAKLKAEYKALIDGLSFALSCDTSVALTAPLPDINSRVGVGPIAGEQ